MKQRIRKAAALCAVLAAAMCVSGCNIGAKPSQTSAVVSETTDPNSVEVPDLSGLSRVQVEMKYPKLNFHFDETYNDDYDEDQVISQSPSPGTKIKKNDTIKVEISLGGKLVEVDDYTGRNIDDARTLIEKQGLVCETVYDETDAVARNCIIRTTPTARSMVEKGSTVVCYVNVGMPEQEIRVPDMIGMTIEDAMELATNNSIGLTVTYDDSSALEPGTVIKQGIDADTVVEPNTRVEVVVSGENASAARQTSVVVSLNQVLEGEFELKYYIDGTLVPEKTEIKELSLTREIKWEMSGTDVHTYSIIVTSLATGKSGKLYEMEIDFTTDPPSKNHHDTFNANVFTQLMS